jgi:hypothetical protein
MFAVFTIGSCVPGVLYEFTSFDSVNVPVPGYVTVPSVTTLPEGEVNWSVTVITLLISCGAPNVTGTALDENGTVVLSIVTVAVFVLLLVSGIVAVYAKDIDPPFFDNTAPIGLGVIDTIPVKPEITSLRLLMVTSIGAGFVTVIVPVTTLLLST